MAEDVFLPLFLKALSEIDSLIVHTCNEFFKELYSSLWHNFNKSTVCTGNFVVCDGSYQISELQGGTRIVYARALAHKYKGNKLVEPFPDIYIKVGHRLKRVSLYMKALELRSLKLALESCCNGSLAIYDGSLYPTLPPVIAKFTQQEIEAVTEWLNALYQLYHYSFEHKHLLLAISKDSYVSYLRVRTLVSSLASEDPDLGQVLSRERSLRRIAKRLRELVQTEFSSKRELLKTYLTEFERPTSDEEALDESTSEPGLSTSLKLAPQPIYLGEEVKAKTKDWWSSVMRRRLRASQELKCISDVLDHLYSLPPIAIFYWRPWHGVGVYRVDVAGWNLGITDRWGDMGGDSFTSSNAFENCKKIAAILNGLSPEPYAVKPLTDVDTLVRLDGRTYRECYEPLIMEKLRSLGLKAYPTKRKIREFVLRRLG